MQLTKKRFNEIGNGKYYISSSIIYQKFITETCDGQNVHYGEPIMNRNISLDHSSKKVIPVSGKDILRVLRPFIMCKEIEYKNAL